MKSATLRTVDSRGELEEILRKANGILIGDAKSSGDFYTIEYPSGSAGVPIGLAAESFGIEPSAMLDSQGIALTVAHGKMVSRVLTKDGAVVFNAEFISPVYEFIRFEDDGTVIVLHEIGLTKLSPAGNVAWEFSASDVIEGHTIAGDAITLQTADGKSQCVSLTTGQPCKRGME